MDEIKLGDLVTYIPGTLYANNSADAEDTRQLWMVIRITYATFTLMQYTSVEDIKDWRKDARKIQDCYKIAVRRELFQTQLMQAELHDWFLQKKGARNEAESRT